MTIIKTLLLQAFLLLAFLGAVQAMFNTALFPPSIEGDQDGKTIEPIGSGSNVDCGKGLTLRCKSSTSHGAKYMKFQKDGNDLEKSDPWKAVTPGSGVSAEDVLEHVLSTTTAVEFGGYKCLSAISENGTDASRPSTLTFDIECKGCTTNKSCTDNTAKGKHSYCKVDQCACIVQTVLSGDKYGECKECNTGTNTGCKYTSKKPQCADGTCVACNSAERGVLKGVCSNGGECKDDGSCTPKKSSAGTVTSTACLVIASVVVALMN